jgi:hypothetical protein
MNPAMTKGENSALSKNSLIGISVKDPIFEIPDLARA